MEGLGMDSDEDGLGLQKQIRKKSSATSETSTLLQNSDVTSSEFIEMGSATPTVDGSDLVLGGAGGGVLVRLLHPRVDVVHVQQARLHSDQPDAD